MNKTICFSFLLLVSGCGLLHGPQEEPAPLLFGYKKIEAKENGKATKYEFYVLPALVGAAGTMLAYAAMKKLREFMKS